MVEARFWADSHRANLMDTASAARVAIVQALRAAGINLPDGTQRGCDCRMPRHRTLSPFLPAAINGNSGLGLHSGASASTVGRSSRTAVRGSQTRMARSKEVPGRFQPETM